MIEFFLRRSAFTNFCTLILLGVGIYQFTHVKREVFPDVKMHMLRVVTPYPGAAPEEVEKLVTNPVEEAIRGISNIDRVESVSAASLSHIFIRLEDDMGDYEVDRTITEIEQAVNRINDLPKEAEPPVVIELSTDSPLISLFVMGGTRELRHRAADDLIDALEDLQEVSRVIGDGKPAREIWVEADPAKLAAFELSLGQMSSVIAGENVSLTAGKVMAGERELQVRTVSGISTAQDVGEVIIMGNDEREFVRVRDVARVRETFEDENYHVRVDGKPAIILQVMKHKEADAINLAQKVREVKEMYAPGLAELGITLKEGDDLSFYIERRLNVMRNNMLLGAFLVLGAMLLFLNWRLAIVASFGIGLSLASVFAFGVPLGVSFNTFTAMAFIIVLGMLNDDAIVVTDNIYRHLQMGKSKMQAAIDGTREVISPVMAAIATSCVAFLPFAMMSGIMGRLMYLFPVIIIISLLSSLMEAFFILPSHVHEMVRFGAGSVHKASPRWFDLLLARYRSVLAWSLNNRKTFLAVSAAAVVVTAGLGILRMKVAMFPSGLIDIFLVSIEMPGGTRLEKTDEALKRVEKVVMERVGEDLDVMKATIGEAGGDWEKRRATYLAQVQVNLHPQEERTRLTSDVVRDLRENMGEIPGVKKLIFEEVKPGPPVGPEFLARIRGKNSAQVVEVANKYKAALEEIPGVTDISDSLQRRKEELVVRPSSADLSYAGLNATAVGRELMAAYHGIEATKIRRADEEVVVRVKLGLEDQESGSVKQLLVSNQMGKQVPISQLVQLKTGLGEEYIAHYNYKRMIYVTASVDEVNATSFAVNREMRGKFANVSQEHPGVDVIYGGEEEETRKSFRSLGRAFVVALLLNFAILMAIFSSGVQPFLILLTVPIGLMGASLALMAHGKPLSLMALLGAVAMTGVVVNNAIVLLDFTNRLRAKGMEMRKALVEAGAVRLRPIFASSITTLMCLFPTAYGIGGKEPFVQPLALTMAWGLAFATPLTLLVIPVAYSFLEDAGAYVRHLAGLNGKPERIPESAVRVDRLAEAPVAAYSRDA